MSSWKGQRAGHLLLLVIFLFAVWTGRQGLDFGQAFDEQRIVQSVQASVREGLFLPRWYNYPSLPYAIAVAALLTDALGVEVDDGGGRDWGARRALYRASRGQPYHLRLRGVFLLLTSLSIAWTYLAVLRWRGSWPEAALAAGVLGSSWEVAYHARWIAPDGLLMQFGILTLLLLITARKTGRSRWLAAAAIAAGLGCGAKYTGGILLLPVLAAALLQVAASGESISPAARGARVLALAFLCCAVFVASTPGVLLEPFEFAEDVQSEIHHYAQGHPGHTVEPGIPYALQAGRYLASVLLSRYPPVALSLFAFAVVGLATVTRRDRVLGLLFLSVPLVYIAFMCTQRVLIVRNLLILTPFLAVLVARGVAVVLGALPARIPRAILIAAIVGALGANGSWLWRSARSIQDHSRVLRGESVVRFLRANPDTRFALSPPVIGMLPETSRELPNVVSPGEEAAACIFVTTAVKRRRHWPANIPGRYTVIFGAHEVNFDYYPAWRNPVIIALSTSDAKALALTGRRAPCSRGRSSRPAPDPAEGVEDDATPAQSPGKARGNSAR